MTLRVTVEKNSSAWDEAVLAAGGHPLQLWGWGELKSAHSWTAQRLIFHDGDTPVGWAQVLFRKLPPPFSQLAYVPRGPHTLPGYRPQVLTQLRSYVQKNTKAIGLLLEPDWPEPYSPLPRKVKDEQIDDWKTTADHQGIPVELHNAGFYRSENTGLIPRTLVVDLTPTADQLLAALSSTTRQNVRKSLRRQDSGELRFGLVESAADYAQVLEINKETAKRAGFPIHSDEYHDHIRQFLGGHSQIVGAWVDDEVVAFTWLVVSGDTAFELYGGVNLIGMKKRVNYGLKYWAMLHVKEAGVTRYDFNGLLNDGISSFKRQFARHEDMLVGTWETALSPRYQIFATALPVVRTGLKRTLPATANFFRELRSNPKAVLVSARKNMAERMSRQGKDSQE